MKRTFPSLSHIHFILLLIVIGLMCFGNAIQHPFVHDDKVFILNNPYISDFNLKNIFLQTSETNKLYPLANTYYRPFLNIIYRWQYQLMGFNAHGYHLFNIILHILNALIVYLLMFRLSLGKKGWSFVIALFFLVHPVQSEAVACVAGISNLMFAYFFLLALYFYVCSYDFPGFKSLYVYFIGLICFMLA
ncbi:MAG: hypothetical protein KC713_10400, partial [Candidatus Omnitrophica bacterium]|nr:hypothetical protein [Candidatus Omnitrophota bacterium]